MVSTDAPSTKAVLMDEPMAKVACQGAEKQTPNRLQTEWTLDELANTAQTITRIAAGWRDSSRPVQVLQALCDLTAAQPARLELTQDVQKWGFTALEIGEALQRRKIFDIGRWASDPGTAKDRMNKHWSKLEEIWQRQAPTIDDGLKQQGLAIGFSPHREEGGGAGKNTRYGFRFNAQVDLGKSEAEIDLLRIPQVKYRHKDISDNRVVRWMSDHGLYLGSWGGKLYLAIFLLLLIAIVGWLLLAISVIAASSSSVTVLKLVLFFSAIPLIFYSAFAWQLHLLANKVALAPLLLQPLSVGDYLLELRKDDGAKLNTMYLVRYAADCPICGEAGKDAIRVESGRLEFFGRLVGRCSRAPNAHVFSFDHVSRVGRFLR